VLFYDNGLKQGEFSRILLPYDGKEMSDLALEEATKFAKFLGSKITILYVIDERYARPSALMSFISEKTVLNEARKELRRVLASAAENMLKQRMSRLNDSGINAEIKVAFGTPSEEILKLSDSKMFDIIIMGSRSLKRFKKIRALGSVARRASELSETPVMLVHWMAKVGEEPTTTYRKILVPYDINSRHSQRALEFAVRVARAFDSELHLLNVVEELYLSPRMERQHVRSTRTGERVNFQQYLKELYRDMKNSAKGMLDAKSREIREKKGFGEGKIRTKAVLGHPPDKIIEYMEEGIDLVVMGTLGRKGVSKIAGLGSVARKVSEDAPCPVILIH
jgi:nucleotide-binding universal stress UspA family protein